MIEFFNTKVCRARVHHKCEYCGKDISPGEKYERCSGKMYGDFFDYCLCLRCSKLLEYFYGGEGEYELGNIEEEIEDCDILNCPNCKQRIFREVDYPSDMQSVEIVCKNCNCIYKVDISEDAIQRHIENKILIKKRMKIKVVNGECEYLTITKHKTTSRRMDEHTARLLVKNGDVKESERIRGYPICINDRFYFARDEESEE